MIIWVIVEIVKLVKRTTHAERLPSVEETGSAGEGHRRRFGTHGVVGSLAESRVCLEDETVTFDVGRTAAGNFYFCILQQNYQVFNYSVNNDV